LHAQENRSRAASAKYVLAACCYTILHTRRFIKMRTSPRWNIWSCRVMIMPLIATVSVVNCALIRIARTMVIAWIRPIAIYANVRQVTPRMIVLLTLTNASTTSAKTARVVSTVLLIIPACARTDGRDGCEYSLLFLNYFKFYIQEGINIFYHYILYSFL